jgi:hypothetical protein
VNSEDVKDTEVSQYGFFILHSHHRVSRDSKQSSPILQIFFVIGSSENKFLWSCQQISVVFLGNERTC